MKRILTFALIGAFAFGAVSCSKEGGEIPAIWQVLLYILGIAFLVGTYRLFVMLWEYIYQKIFGPIDRKIERWGESWFKQGNSSGKKPGTIAREANRPSAYATAAKPEPAEIELDLSKYRGNTAQDDRTIILHERCRRRKTESSAWLSTLLLDERDGGVKPRNGVVGCIARVHAITPGEESLEDLLNQGMHEQ